MSLEETEPLVEPTTRGSPEDWKRSLEKVVPCCVVLKCVWEQRDLRGQDMGSPLPTQFGCTMCSLICKVGCLLSGLRKPVLLTRRLRGPRMPRVSLSTSSGVSSSRTATSSLQVRVVSYEQLLTSMARSQSAAVSWVNTGAGGSRRGLRLGRVDGQVPQQAQPPRIPPPKPGYVSRIRSCIILSVDVTCVHGILITCRAHCGGSHLFEPGGAASGASLLRWAARGCSCVMWVGVACCCERAPVKPRLPGI